MHFNAPPYHLHATFITFANITGYKIEDRAAVIANMLQ